VREGKQSETLDGSMTYFLEGVAPAVYAYDYFNFNNAPLRWEDKRQDKIAAVFVTNCNPKNGRNIITQEVSPSLVPVTANGSPPEADWTILVCSCSTSSRARSTRSGRARTTQTWKKLCASLGCTIRWARPRGGT